MLARLNLITAFFVYLEVRKERKGKCEKRLWRLETAFPSPRGLTILLGLMTVTISTVL